MDVKLELESAGSPLEQLMVMALRFSLDQMCAMQSAGQSPVSITQPRNMLMVGGGGGAQQGFMKGVAWLMATAVCSRRVCFG